MKLISKNVLFIICLWPWCMIYNEKKHSDLLLNRYLIFLEQKKELLFIGFYIWFVIEFLLRFAMTWNIRESYKKISFVLEADFGEPNLAYTIDRHHYDWARRWLL
jgi:hypothetical protein